MLVMVGGETGDFLDDAQTLTMDAHVSYFTAGFATWAKLLVSDKNGAECTGDGILCPEPRRDSSVKMMGNDGSSNGRLLMYGGLTVGSAEETSSVGRAYLEGAASKNLKALTDLWYLDVRPLTIDCVRGLEVCERLKWTLVDVPGTLPAGRWGAGLI